METYPSNQSPTWNFKEMSHASPHPPLPTSNIGDEEEEDILEGFYIS